MIIYGTHMQASITEIEEVYAANGHTFDLKIATKLCARSKIMRWHLMRMLDTQNPLCVTELHTDDGPRSHYAVSGLVQSLRRRGYTVEAFEMQPYEGQSWKFIGYRIMDHSADKHLAMDLAAKMNTKFRRLTHEMARAGIPAEAVNGGQRGTCYAAVDEDWAASVVQRGPVAYEIATKMADAFTGTVREYRETVDVLTNDLVPA